MRYFVLIFILVCVGCTPRSPIQPELQAVTAVPPLANTSLASLCNTIRESRGTDWLLNIEALQLLEERNETCVEGQDTGIALYGAHVSYAELLENAGRTTEAQSYYIQALNYTETDTRARDALNRIGGQPGQNTPPDTCADDIARTARENTLPYVPSEVSRINLSNGQLTLNEEPFLIRGVLYEPRDFPGTRFLNEASTEALETEIQLLADANLNTVRIYLIHDVLFQCEGDGAVPVPEAFARLDAVVNIIISRGMRVILVLNHQPDLTEYPLYSSPFHTTAQTVFLAQRYANEPGILAWDIRDSGDSDYTGGNFEREAVITWLTETVQVIRQNAPEQLVTAGWQQDAAATAPFVDFVSFQQYSTVDDLRQQIALLRTQTDKPLFLAGVGYPTANGDELGQRNRLYDALLAAENNRLLGWSIVEAFDHPATVCEDCERFGLWNTSYFPKLALDAPLSIIAE